MCGSRSRWSGPGRPSRAARHNYHRVTQSEGKTEKSLSLCPKAAGPGSDWSLQRAISARTAKHTVQREGECCCHTLLTTAGAIGPFPRG